VPFGADAAGRLLPQRQVRMSSPAGHGWHPVRQGSHVFYGTIAAINRGVITLRRRNSPAVAVDAAAAIANGDYSAPLFVGKIVSIDGNHRHDVNGIACVSDDEPPMTVAESKARTIETILQVAAERAAEQA